MLYSKRQMCQREFINMWQTLLHSISREINFIGFDNSIENTQANHITFQHQINRHIFFFGVLIYCIFSLFCCRLKDEE